MRIFRWYVKSGSGNDAFGVPSVVTRLHVPGAYRGSSSNFIVWCGTQLFVNEVIGTSSFARTTTGTHQLTAPRCGMRIEHSNGVQWT